MPEHSGAQRREPFAQRRRQLQRPLQSASEAVADPNRERRRRIVIVTKIEMGVESGRLINFGDTDSQQVGQRHEVSRAQAAVLVLQSMQMFQQQVAAQGQVGQQLHDGITPVGIDPSALTLPVPLAPPCDRLLVTVHALVSRFEVAIVTAMIRGYGDSTIRFGQDGH